jgi:hypothetical protein
VPGRNPYLYAILRLVPSIERGEAINAGVVLLCRSSGFFGVRIELDPDRLAALSPATNKEDVEDFLAGIQRIAAGDSSAGPIGSFSEAEKFHWLTAPSSTIVQPSPVHTGMCDDPVEELEKLFQTLVKRPSPEAVG